MKPSQRLFVASDLSHGTTVTLEAGQAHYLANVLRLPIGGEVLLFNGRDGEWIGAVACLRQSRVQETLPDLWLLFAPVKGDRTDYIVEKATELGVAGIVPVITERTIVRKVNQERLQARCIEAAEQCGRLCVPAILPAQPLSAFYQSPSDGGLILFADEAGEAVTIGKALATSPLPKIAILIGPEGGFTPQERDTLRACAHVRPVTLGPRILRADTAAYAGLTLVQSAWGDWKDGA
jgi:16S rRNA (uracil1498-N3)-methyltransferase